MYKAAITREDLDRMIALKALRENIYLSQPGKYSALDFMDDMPGRARTIAPFFNDVLPSRAIISSDADDRKEQIRVALERIKATRSSKSELGKQMLGNAASMGLTGLPVGFLLAAGIRLMGFRSPRITNATGKKVWRSPVAPVQTAKRLLKGKNRAAAFTRWAGREALIGGGIGAATGVAYPLITHGANLSDARLDEAAAILQKHPYLTSLPVQDMLSSIADKRVEKSQLSSRAGGAMTGGLLGAATGAVGAYTPATLGLLGQLLAKPFTKKPLNFNNLRRAGRQAPALAGMMGGGGALMGALTPNDPLGMG